MRARNKQLIVATSLFFLVMALNPMRISAGVPTDQIKGTVDRALVLLKDSRLKGTAKTKERRERLRQILFARFDFAEMAKRALGPEWRRRTSQEQDEFVRLFADLLERAYADTIESFSDEKIVYVGERLDGNFAEVSSRISNSRGQEFSIDYKTRLSGAEWKVYDVIVENMSLVNNYRSQFRRVISNSSYEELVRRLKDKQAEGATGKN